MYCFLAIIEMSDVLPSSGLDDTGNSGATALLYHPFDCVAMFAFAVRTKGI
jgi:hypothetical protein